MSVLVFAESSEGKFKKVAFEAISYGNQVASQMGSKMVVLTINANDVSELHQYGAEKVLTVNESNLATFNAKAYANVIQQVADKEGAKLIIIDSSANGLYLAPLVAVNMNAGLASNVIDVPSTYSPFTVKRKAFSNKAFQNTIINSENKVVGLAKNSFGVKENSVSGASEAFTPSLSDDLFGTKSTSIEKTTGKVTIADADIVVSGGRGLKSGDNWGMIEELAEVLGAATACSKPVADLDWRPHEEHVGQTGKQVASNLYIAIGISGAIQHLAGVNASKVKVVINTDPEAPFFKAADYGIVGDAFEVVPKLIESLKTFKANN